MTSPDHGAAAPSTSDTAAGEAWTPQPEQALYPPEDAERFYKESAGKSYQPSNGMEGELFMGRWCAHCERDQAFRENPDEADGCAIAGNSMCFRAGDPDYPAEWRYASDGQPQCTAFQPVPALREWMIENGRTRSEGAQS